jgi:N-terminal EH-domain containing protein
VDNINCSHLRRYRNKKFESRMSSQDSSTEVASPTAAAKGQLKAAARKIINSQKADGNVIRELKQLYSTRLLPIEKQYFFSKLHYPEILDSELSAKPTVLLIGQYSTGKTSFIRNLLGMDYPEIHIGPEVLSDTASHNTLVRSFCAVSISR